MFITFTGSKATAEQAREVDKFLAAFLPRYARQPGVLAVYHFSRPDGSDSTVTIWENQEDVKAYREGELIKEVMAFEKAHSLVVTREGYPLSYAISEKIKGLTGNLTA